MQSTINLSDMAARWPSAYVTRQEIGIFTGGILHPRTMANRDCRGDGIPGAFRIGRTVAYRVVDVIAYLEAHATSLEG